MKYNVKENLKRIQEEIVPFQPNIIAVTKYFDKDAIIEAYQAGLRNFAESRAIEAIEKISELPEEIRQNSKFHFIGHLQSNKVRKVVENFDVIHSVDSLKLAEKISDCAVEFGKVQNILIQVNNANEIQKSGFSVEELFEDFAKIQNLPNVKIIGLMNMTPLGSSEKELEILFEELAALKTSLENEFHIALKELSMGMSQDYKIAAQKGSTMLRIGRKLFS